MRILLVEDDPQLGKALRIGLEQYGHAVDWVQDGEHAVQAAGTSEHEALVLDLGLPRLDGMGVLQVLRRRGFAGVIVIVTARDEVADRIDGLDSGADDFVVKPFELAELEARLRAAARRVAGRSHNLLVHGALILDPAARQATQGGQPVPLTAREFALLLYLVERAGRVASREQLHEALYSWDAAVESNALEVHIHNLRRKLGRDAIRTVHGQGYLVPAAGAAAHA